MDELIGRTIDRYQIIERIGIGGMATVFKAYQPALDRVVAIKVLPPHFLHDETFVSRFQREARSVAGLNHPNILPVYDFGRVDNIVFVTMQYIPGGTLKDRINEPLDLRFCARIIEGVGSALDYAHRRNIIHRDVKPTNILLGDSDWPFLADFGIAKLSDANTRLTKTGTGIGTPEYMSPEQAQGLPIDGRSDVYSLGAVLYEMVTGSVPFSGDTPLSVVFKHVYEPARPVRELNPNIPDSIEAVIAKALAKNPGDRYQSGEEFSSEFWMIVSSLALPPDPRRPTPASLPVMPRLSGEIPVGTDPSLEPIYREARAALDAKNPDLAREKIRAIQAVNPTYRDTEDLLVQANAQIERAQSLETLYNNGIRAIRAGTPAAAVEVLKRVIALDPTYRDAKIRFAEAERLAATPVQTAVIPTGEFQPAVAGPADSTRVIGTATPPTRTEPLPARPSSVGRRSNRGLLIGGLIAGGILLCGGVAAAVSMSGGAAALGIGQAIATNTATAVPNTATAVPPTGTPVPPTETPVPTVTPEPPTPTPEPTSTPEPVPPTNTPRPAPTATPRPANTNTPVPATATSRPPPTATQRPAPTATPRPPAPPPGGGGGGGGGGGDSGGGDAR